MPGTLNKGAWHPFVIPKFWAYGGGDMAFWGGTKGVFVEIAKGDFNQLFKVLAD